MKNRKNVLKGAGVLLIVAAMVFTTAVATYDTSIIQTIRTNNNTTGGYGAYIDLEIVNVQSGLGRTVWIYQCRDHRNNPRNICRGICHDRNR
jgi:hypothetical protein